MFNQFINEPLVLPRYEKGGRVDHTEYHNVLHVLDPREQLVRATIYHTGAIGNCCRDEVLLKSVLIKDLSWPEPRGLDLGSVNVSITAAGRLKPRVRKLQWFHQSFLWRHSDLLILRGWDYPAERPQSIPADRIILDLPMLRTQVEEGASAKASQSAPRMAALDAPAHRSVVQLLCYPRTRPATKAGLLLTAPLDPPPQRHVAGSSNSIEPLARSMKPGFLWHVAQCLDAPASNGAALGRSFVLPDDWPGHVPGFLLLNKCCQAVHFVSMVTW